MLSREDNELMCRVGQGTPMGALLRQYWMPCLPSSELPERDGPPKKVRLLGEDLVAFRDTRGEVGLLAANCPHRGASLFFGRNEECGLRCPYHGWKYDVSGRCVDMPNEPEESAFREKIQARAYPCREVNGAIWTYMGPRKAPPPFPTFEINTLAPEYVYPPLLMLEECNWVQALEGDIDSSHIDFVHAKLPDSKQRGTLHRDRRPRLEVLPTDYGACYSARRRSDTEGLYWHRITQYIMPYFTMIAASDPNLVSMRSWVPIDDHYTLQVMIRGRLDRPVTEDEKRQTRDPFASWGGYLPASSDPRSRYYTKANIHNDYLVDYELQKKELMIGIPFLVNLQDRAMTETMGPIYDRSQEHLGTTDAMVIYVRRRLIDAAKSLRDAGAIPANVDDASLYRVRPASALLPEDESWVTATEKARQSDAGVPIAWVPFV